MRHLLTVVEAAQELRVPPSWVYQHLDTIGYHKIGRYVRIEADDLQRYIEGTRHGSCMAS